MKQVPLHFAGEVEQLCRCGHRRGDHMKGLVTACQALVAAPKRTWLADCVCLVFKPKERAR